MLIIISFVKCFASQPTHVVRNHIKRERRTDPKDGFNQEDNLFPPDDNQSIVIWLNGTERQGQVKVDTDWQ